MRSILLVILLSQLLVKSGLADSIVSTAVGPGIQHHRIVRDSGPWKINVMEIDLTDSMNSIETIKAYDRLAGVEQTSSMANRLGQHTDKRVVGGVNGDFYGGSGISVGAQVIQGTLLKRPYPRSVFGLTNQKRPFANVLEYYGQVVKQNTFIHQIEGINEERRENELVLYNHYFGASTASNQWGTECRIEFLNSPPGINAPQYAVVVEKDSLMGNDSGNMTIPNNMGAILSGHGDARDFLNENIFVGDSIAVQLTLNPTDLEIVMELIGGTPRLIRNGIQSIEWEAESVGYSFAHDRHPRTAVGFSADSNTVYFFTVDGRQADFSVGMSLYELADYMLEWGVYQGINLDGGGSTTMVLEGDVINSPSDFGVERSVSNAIVAISRAPVGPLAHLELPREVIVMVDHQVQLNPRGRDQYFNPVIFDTDSLIWSCDADIGSISASGLFTAQGQESNGYIYVHLGMVTDTAALYVTDIDSISLIPDPVVVELDEAQLLSARAYDGFGRLLELDETEYTWWASPELASISTEGLLVPHQLGTGSVSASYGDVSVSVALFVGTASTVITDDFTSTSNYSLSGSQVVLGDCQLTTDESLWISSPSSGRLDYSLTTGGTSVLYLNCEIPISGAPPSVSIYVYGDNSGHWLRGEFENAGGEKFLINFTDASPGIDWENEWREMTVFLADAAPHWGNPSASLSYPITWTKLYLAETDDNNKNSGSIYLDNFQMNYLVTDIESETPMVPDHFKVTEVFPNPFNASLQLSFAIPHPEELKIHFYSLDGRELATLSQQAVVGNLNILWEPSDLSSGVYIFRAQLGKQVVSGKCLLLK